MRLARTRAETPTEGQTETQALRKQMRTEKRSVAGSSILAALAKHPVNVLTEETGWLTELPNALIVLATFEATLGNAAGCQEHAARAWTEDRFAGQIVPVEAPCSLDSMRLDLASSYSALSTVSLNSFARRICSSTWCLRTVTSSCNG